MLLRVDLDGGDTPAADRASDHCMSAFVTSADGALVDMRGAHCSYRRCHDRHAFA
jgi:hypothetical protein